MPINLDRSNERIQNWGHDLVLMIQANGNAMQITHRANSPSSSASLPRLKDKYRMRSGTIDQVSIKLPRQLIWTAKGAGKGRGGSVGSKWTDKYGNSRSTDPKSFGKMGTAGRTAKDFFNSILDSAKGVPELADIVAEETGSAVINKLFIK